MEDNYRNNVVDFSVIYLDKSLDDLEKIDFKTYEFTNYIYYQLFNVDINKTGYGLDNSTKQMTNDIGDLKIYNELDSKKENYLSNIKKGDLVFFHTKEPNINTPAPNNHYPGHVGIYIGDKGFIHVIDNKITIDKIEDKWLNCLIASRDVIKVLKNKKTMF